MEPIKIDFWEVATLISLALAAVSFIVLVVTATLDLKTTFIGALCLAIICSKGVHP